MTRRLARLCTSAVVAAGGAVVSSRAGAQAMPAESAPVQQAAPPVTIPQTMNLSPTLPTGARLLLDADEPGLGVTITQFNPTGAERVIGSCTTPCGLAAAPGNYLAHFSGAHDAPHVQPFQLPPQGVWLRIRRAGPQRGYDGALAAGIPLAILGGGSLVAGGVLALFASGPSSGSTSVAVAGFAIGGLLGLGGGIALIVIGARNANRARTHVDVGPIASTRARQWTLTGGPVPGGGVVGAIVSF